MSGLKEWFSLVILQLIIFQKTNGLMDCCEDYCYSWDKERYQAKNFATKTAYDVVKGPETDKQHLVSNCEASKFWLISRHGTRLPGAKSIDKLSELDEFRDLILENYEIRANRPSKGKLCDDDLELLRNWKWDKNITSQYDSFLTDQGWVDLKFLARRYQHKFQDVLINKYDDDTFLFRHTHVQRTEASFKAYVEGLFGPDAYLSINLPPENGNDTLLKPYKFCPTYQQNDVKNNPNSEYSKFLNSSLYRKTVNDISTRLAFRYSLTNKQIDTIWDMCRYDQAWHLQDFSAWCVAFTKEQVKILEYKEDLEYYYVNGYGTDGNDMIACHAVNDMLMHLESTKKPNVVSYFTHESEIQLFLVALGAAKDKEALRADNYYTMNRRHFRSSTITPFTGNVAVVKYKCKDERDPNKVMFFLNEKPLLFDWCNVGLCNLDNVLEKYKNFKFADCSKEFCKRNTSTNLMPSMTILLFLSMNLIRYFM